MGNGHQVGGMRHRQVSPFIDLLARNHQHVPSMQWADVKHGDTNIV